ncbi:leucine-rich repeat protein, partial [Skeletonema marinoi]
MGCTALADTLRGWGASNLKHLDLDGNGIDDQGLQVLAAGVTNTKLEELYLSDNLITGAGLRSMSDYFQSESCCLKTLNVLRNDFGDEGAVALADGLMGNKSLTSLHFIPHQSGITNAGWAAFSKLLCDPSSIESTYLSNHNIGTIGEHIMKHNTPPNIRRYLDLNEHPHPVIHKILKSHSDLDMEPFFQWKLKLLPVVVDWFQSASSGMMSFQRQSLPSRELSALYKFVRGMPAFAVTSYWQQLVVNAQAKRRRIDNE